LKLNNKTILIAGASSGIGREVALQLAQRRNRLIITARRQPLLAQLAAEIQAAGSECLPLAADALDATAAANVVQHAVHQFGVIDAALVNIGDGPAFNMADETALRVTDNMRDNYDTLVNYLTPLIVQMKQQQHGLIAHTNSLAGFIGLPQQGPYSAAKGACRLLMDTCRVELAAFNIRFVSLYPGFVATDKVSSDGIPAPLEISAVRAARYMITGMETQQRDYLFPPSMRALIQLARVLPKPVTGWVTQRMMTR